jgi:hypothetical protein
MTERTETLTELEAEQLYEAAEYYRKRDWTTFPDELAALNSAIKKLRRADVLRIARD